MQLPVENLDLNTLFLHAGKRQEDVLGHSVKEMPQLLERSVPAVKAAAPWASAPSSPRRVRPAKKCRRHRRLT